MSRQDSRGDSRGSHYRQLAIFGSVIFLLPTALFGGYFAGALLDRWLGTAPWLTIVGLLLGGVAGFVELFRLLRRAG